MGGDKYFDKMLENLIYNNEQMVEEAYLWADFPKSFKDPFDIIFAIYMGRLIY